MGYGPFLLFLHTKFICQGFGVMVGGLSVDGFWVAFVALLGLL
jgi:hypothetical protein